MDIVFTADDFGYSTDTVESTIDALERGIATGASIMVGMPATDAAIEYACARPELTFGAHLIFVRDGVAQPRCGRSEVRHLVDGRGRFRGTNYVRADALLGRLPVGEIERELDAQLATLVQGGVRLTYVDSHRHLHKLPAFQTALRRVLPRYGISRVRGAQDVYLERRLLSPTYWLGSKWKQGLAAAFSTTDHTYMPHGEGGNWPSKLLDAITSMAGSLEVGFHPGKTEEWRRAEASTGATFVELARARGHRFVSWSDVL